ncbi:hypothetical protein O3M35_007028 [Rhynocoris fuscipes]|uniref:Secreted protein n=1 Tax=Rhynocoris fuscipes TaxID=488301 RepID=A0AAW1DH97_9HEMI
MTILTILLLMQIVTAVNVAMRTVKVMALLVMNKGWCNVMHFATRLRTTLYGAVACRVLRWANAFTIDYRGGGVSAGEEGNGSG